MCGATPDFVPPPTHTHPLTPTKRSRTTAVIGASTPSPRWEPAGVAPERQKIMVKGGMLKDDSDWATLSIKPGQKLMMMGTAGALLPPP